MNSLARIVIASFVGRISTFLVGIAVLPVILASLEDCDGGCAGGVGEVSLIIVGLFAVAAFIVIFLLLCLVISRGRRGLLSRNDLVLSSAIWMSPLSIVLLGCLFIGGGIADPVALLAVFSPVVAASIGAAVCWHLLGEVRFRQNVIQERAPNVA